MAGTRAHQTINEKQEEQCVISPSVFTELILTLGSMKMLSTLSSPLECLE